MDNIRIDQSHCNYYLAKWIELQKGIILFTDGGRVSRGGPGSQGILLNIFESNGLPIPDIVAILDYELLIIEIDKNITKANKSLVKYKTCAKLIQDQILKAIDIVRPNEIRFGFCFTGLKSDFFINRLSEAQASWDYFFAFVEPRRPLMIRLRGLFKN